MKSGWAAAVLLVGPPASPRVADSRRIELSDPAIPESRQPYHAGFGTARSKGPELTRLLGGVRRFGRKSVVSLIRHYREAGHRIVGAGAVVGSLIDPESITNEHIRIHALEGRLFRSVVAEAAVGCKLPCSIWRERDLSAVAAEAFHRPVQNVRAKVAALGDAAAGSWRAEQKAAAVAAWLVLAARGRAKRPIRGKRKPPRSSREPAAR